MKKWLSSMNGIAADMLFSGGYVVAPRHAHDGEMAASGGAVTPLPPTPPSRGHSAATPDPALPRKPARLAVG